MLSRERNLERYDLVQTDTSVANGRTWCELQDHSIVSVIPNAVLRDKLTNFDQNVKVFFKYRNNIEN